MTLIKFDQKNEMKMYVQTNCQTSMKDKKFVTLHRISALLALCAVDKISQGF